MNTIRWGHHALEVELDIAEDNAVRLSLPGGGQPNAPLPLVEVTATGHGRHWSSNSLVDTTIGARLRYRSHRAFRDGDWHVLAVDLHDALTGLAVSVWNADSADLTLTLASVPSAVLLRLS